MELVNNASRSQLNYFELMPGIVNFIDKGTTNDCKVVVNSIKEVISEKKSNPSQKLLALELLQSLMLLNKPEFIKLVESKLIIFLGKLAERVPSILFEDSLNSKENQIASENFLNKLLNYIYIWANEFTYGDKQVNEYAKVFYKLRDTVKFPSFKARNSSRSATIPPSPENIKKPVMSLKTIIGTLEVLEGMKDPLNTQVGSEMIDSLIESIPSLEATLKKALDSSNIRVKEKVSNIIERVNRVCGKTKAFSRFSLPQPLKKLDFTDPLPFETSFTSATQRIPVQANIKSPSFSSSSSFVESKSSYFFPENFELKTENEALKKKIEDQEKIISEHEKNQDLLKNQIDELEEKLKVKEIECAYLMKKIKIGGVCNEGKGNENVQDGIDFRLACCDKSQLLIENEQCFVTFEGNLTGNCYVLVLKVLNISGKDYKNLEFEVESAFGFDVKFNNVIKNNLRSCDEFAQEFIIQNLCMTESIPILTVRFEIDFKEFQYNFRIPVTLCRFCRGIDLNINEILNEFELLAFDNDSATIKCEFSLRRCRKLIKLSDNIKVYSKSGLLGLPENCVLAVFGFSQRVYGLISVNQIERTAVVEIRSESISLRKTVLMILVNQIKVI